MFDDCKIYRYSYVYIIDKNLYNEIENFLDINYYLQKEKKLMELINLLNSTQYDYREYKEKLKLDLPEDYKEDFSDEEISIIKETISEFSKI